MSRRLVVLSAGLSQPSSTRLLADQITDAVRARVGARGEAVDVQVLELRELAIDLAQLMTSGIPSQALREARELVSAADGLVAVTPIFTASYSGLFKMFMDALDNQAVQGMPVIIAATAGTPRHSLVLEHAMRPLFTYLGAIVVPTGVFAATDDFGGAEAGSELGRRVRQAADELAALMVAERDAVAGFGADPDEVVSRRARRTSGNGLTQTTSFADLLRGHDGTR